MRKTSTTINPALSRVISETGHTDLIVVTDAGLPIPAGSERIDLAYRPGAPAFLDVLDTVLAELVIEGATVSAEVADSSAHTRPARSCAPASTRHMPT
jgi:D-ribose pyranase